MSLPIFLFCSQLHVFKPATSKAGNSEQYLICLGYKGTNILSQKFVAKLKLVFGEMCSLFSLISLLQQSVLKMAGETSGGCFILLLLSTGPHPPPRAVFPSSSIPPSFVAQLTKCAFKFAKYQVHKDGFNNYIKLPSPSHHMTSHDPLHDITLLQSHDLGAYLYTLLLLTSCDPLCDITLHHKQSHDLAAYLYTLLLLTSCDIT